MQSAEKLGAPVLPSSSSSSSSPSPLTGGVSLRKHSLEVTHGEYRRESFHCEHSLQSLLEIEGENGPAPPSPSSSSSPSPPMGGEIGGLKSVRRMGRQESPLSRDTLITTKEEDSQTTTTTGSQTEGPATKAQSKRGVTETGQRSPSADALKSKVCGTAGETTSSPAPVPSSEVKGQNASVTTGAKVAQRDAAEKLLTSKIVQQQEKKLQVTRAGGAAAAPPQEKTPAGTDKKDLQKSRPPEATHPPRATEGGENGGVRSSDKTPEVTKVKGHTPPAPLQVQTTAASPASGAARSKTDRVLGGHRGTKEGRAHLETLEENPMSPSSTAAPPCSNKSRPMSPGDKASFVTQLTSVAKTVLGPMKGATQEGAKVKDTSKTGEEKRGNAAGKAEVSSSTGRRGAQAGSSAGAGTLGSDKGTSRSSKHHS